MITVCFKITNTPPPPQKNMLKRFSCGESCLVKNIYLLYKNAPTRCRGHGSSLLSKKGKSLKSIKKTAQSACNEGKLETQLKHSLHWPWLITVCTNFLFHKSMYLEVTHFPSLCLGEATQLCCWQRHLHSWGDPSGAPFNHHFCPFFNPDRFHNSQTNQYDRAAALGQLSRPCSPPVNPRPLSNTSHLTLGNPTVLVEDVLRFFAHHLIQVILCNVGHGHHYSSSSFSSSLPPVLLQLTSRSLRERESDWAVKIDAGPASSLQATVRSPAGSSHEQEGTGTELSFSSPHENECVSARWSVCVWVRERTPSDLHQVSATVLIS